MADENKDKILIPETKQAAVEKALHEAFGVNEYEEIYPLTGGLSSALAFKIIVKNNPYLLKILRTQVISDPAHEFTCMQTAAEAGIAPRIWYASTEDRILITDFVDAKPLPEEMIPLIVPVLRTLHSLANFQKPQMGNYLDAMDGFVRRFQAAKLLPDSATGEVFRGYAALSKVYPRHDAGLVASHNDLKPQNMLYDGKHIWLVDWEAAFLNDEYVDLAVVANFFVKNEAQAEAYLEAYFGEPAGSYRSARFYLMHQAVSLFYTAVLLMEAARTLPIDAEITTPDFRTFHQALISNKIDMLTAEAKLQYGMLHLREAAQNMRSPRFVESLAIVANA